MRLITFARLGGIACAAAAFVAQSANAATATGDLDVIANVDPACTVSTSAVDFGTINPSLNTSFQASGSVGVTCTVGTAWTATADNGSNAVALGGGGFIRAMLGQTQVTPSNLQYTLYKDAARTIAWQNVQAFSGVGTGSAQANVVYGTVPNGQTTVAVDSYKDTVQVTVTY